MGRRGIQDEHPWLFLSFDPINGETTASEYLCRHTNQQTQDPFFDPSCFSSIFRRIFSSIIQTIRIHLMISIPSYKRLKLFILLALDVVLSKGLTLLSNVAKIFSHPSSLCVVRDCQITDWVVQNEENHNLLMNAVSWRPESLLKLGVQIARLGLSDVEEIHKAKLSVFNPLANIMDLKCGSGYRDDPKCDYPVSKVFCDNVMETLYNFAIYRELFHHCIDQVLTPLTNVNHLSAFVRRSWMAYCMPDMKYEETR